jgi:hypothetical protein
METPPIYNFAGRGNCSKTAAPHVSLPKLVAKLPSSPPRKRAKGIDLKLTAISDRMASQRAPIDALTPLKRSSCQMPYQANRASA